jgi:hypothetical protein
LVPGSGWWWDYITEGRLARKRKITKHKVAQKANNSEEIALTDGEISHLVSAIEGKNAHKWRRFWECKLKGMNTYRSAKAAGFSESYSRGDIYRDLKPGGLAISKLEQILAKTPETVRKITQLRILTDGLEIDRLALDQYKANPRLAITNPSLLKHLRQLAGVMPQDFQPQPQTINIEAMQIFMKRQLDINVKIFELAENRGIPGRNIIELQQHPEYPELLSEAEKQMDEEPDEREEIVTSTN